MGAEILKALKENGFEMPFPIQETSIPLILNGIDVVGQAHTGTGKTAAFSLPMLTKVKRNGPIQALVLVPTRELAVQVTNEINKLAKYVGIRTVSIYGGQSINIQYDQLKRGVQIVVATPGRLIDHVKHGSIQLDSVKYVVLDEADRMLDMGFIEDIKFILFYINEDRQTCLFSATMPPEILKLAQEYMKDVEEIRLNKEEIGLDTIDQSYLVVYEKQKFKHLCNFIRQRDNAMYRFKRGAEDILVATDIAARGIDVPAVGHVINYDVPEDPLIYFHRIGRTARAGGSGKAISLVSQDRMDDFSRILRQTEHPIRKLNEGMGIEVHVIHHRSNIGYRRHAHNYNNNNEGYRGRSGYRYGTRDRSHYDGSRYSYNGWGRRYNHSQ